MSFAVRIHAFPACAAHLFAFRIHTRGKTTTTPLNPSYQSTHSTPLNPSYQSTHSTFLPPSFGRRCPEGAEVGCVKRYFHMRGCQPRLASLAPLPEEGARMIFNRASPHIYLRRNRHESPSYQSTHSTFLPPSFGRRGPEGAEVGSRSGIFTSGDANPASLRSSAPSRGRGENDF